MSLRVYSEEFSHHAMVGFQLSYLDTREILKRCMTIATYVKLFQTSLLMPLPM